MSITADDLHKLCPRGKPDIIAGVAAASAVLDSYAINTPLRMAHFWAQVAHESDGLRTLQEYASGQEYEGRKDLGNVHPGDGRRYKGRGPFQLTGRANYRAYGALLDLPLEAQPEQAATPAVGLRIACLYWRQNGLNALADKNDIGGITKRINGGFNGLDSRRAYFNQAWRIFGPQEQSERALPKNPKTMATSKTGNAAIGVGGGASLGLMGAYNVGKDAVANAGDIHDTAVNAGALFGLTGSAALLIGGALIIAAGLAFIWWDRRRKLIHEGV